MPAARAHDTRPSRRGSPWRLSVLASGLAVAGAALADPAGPGPARLVPAASVNTLEALGRALTACFKTPHGSSGDAITVLLSLRRDGALLGRPRITFSHLVGPAADQQAFVAAVLGGLQACTPVAVTATLGAAIAGRPLTVRLLGGPPPRRA